MRMTQFLGLNPRARKFLKEKNAKSVLEFQGNTGMFDEPIQYDIYEFAETIDYYGIKQEVKTTLVEATQCEKWSSGSMIYTYLFNPATNKKLFEWNENEM